MERAPTVDAQPRTLPLTPQKLGGLTPGCKSEVSGGKLGSHPTPTPPPMAATGLGFPRVSLCHLVCVCLSFLRLCLPPPALARAPVLPGCVLHKVG